MARTAKKEKTAKALTHEEKLAAALVPVEEQPYPVPGNWCWTKVGVLSSLHRGVSYKKDDAHVDKQENDCLVMRGGNIGEGYIDIDADNVYVDLRIVGEDQLVKKNDIIIVASTGSTKVIGRAGISLADYSDVAFGAFLIAVRPNIKAVPRYMDYYFQSDLYRDRIRVLASGVNINNIRADYITESPYPFAPLLEQQRIVDRIESLFAKLDEAKEKAQAVIDGYEDRKAAILHKAFTGQLTIQWRNSYKGKQREWETVPLETVFQLRSGSTIDVNEEKEHGAIPYIKVADMNLPGNEIQITSSSRYVDESEENRIIPKGSTIFPKRGGAILTNKKRYVGVDKIIADLNTMAVMPIADRLYGWYGYYWMLSVDLRQLNNGSNVPQINNKDMVKLFVPMPSIDEQKAIVSILDSVFRKEIDTQKAAKKALAQIDTMKKAILARAFRGELGTNDPADESAEELLKRIL